MPFIRNEVSEATSVNKPQNTSRVQLLFMACILGVVMGLIFIVIQPLFGMDTLTSRHAAAYQQPGSWSSIAAITIAWVAHLVVSVFYGLLSGIVVPNSARLDFVALFILAISWLKTVIAPPANAIWPQCNIYEV